MFRPFNLATFKKADALFKTVIFNYSPNSHISCILPAATPTSSFSSFENNGFGHTEGFSKDSYWEDPEKLPLDWIKGFSKDKIPYKTFKSSFTRSGGPGGQNVNKVATKVELRFNVEKATWLPKFIRISIQKKIAANKINNKGEYVITSTRTRTQLGNLDDCIDKIYADICQAADTVPRPTSEAAFKRTKKLRLRAKKANETRLLKKKMHSDKKASRSKDFP